MTGKMLPREAANGPSVWSCAWREGPGGASCAGAPSAAASVGGKTRLLCRAHACDQAKDPQAQIVDFLEQPVPLAGDTWLVATSTPEGHTSADLLLAWLEPRSDSPESRRPVCTWFNPESPDSAPERWPVFDAYYEVLCDPAELEADSLAAAQAAAAEVRGYLSSLHPDPEGTRVFRCAWLPGYDGVHDDAPEHGWALVIPVSVRAAFSDPTITGSDPLWAVSAESVVDANSWDGAEHGWGVGCAHLLTIVPAGMQPSLLLKAQEQ